MKKLLISLTWALALATTFTFTSCSKDDDKDTPKEIDKDGDDDEEAADYSEYYQGTWQFVETRTSKEGKWGDVTAVKQIVYYGADGTYKYTINDADAVVGTYKFKKNQIHITWQNGNTQMFKIVSMDYHHAVLELWNNDQAPSCYYHVTRIPTSVDEAKKLLKGQWEFSAALMGKDKEEAYYDFNSDGKMYQVWKIAQNASDNHWYSQYKGQYVGMVLYKRYSFTPAAYDPTQGIVSWYDDISYNTRPYKDLNGLSVLVEDVRWTYPTKKIEYIKVKSPYE